MRVANSFNQTIECRIEYLFDCRLSIVDCRLSIVDPSALCISMCIPRAEENLDSDSKRSYLRITIESSGFWKQKKLQAEVLNKFSAFSVGTGLVSKYKLCQVSIQTIWCFFYVSLLPCLCPSVALFRACSASSSFNTLSKGSATFCDSPPSVVNS
jgi:hypothetical protein